MTEALQKFTASAAIQVGEDNLTVMNLKQIFKAVVQTSRGCLLLRVNHISSVTKSLQVGRLGLASAWGIVVSHSSFWETEYTCIADLGMEFCTG